MVFSENSNSNTTANNNWLLFLEDPGAVTFIYRVIEVFPEYGVNLIVVASGHAVSLLKKKDIFFLEHDIHSDADKYLDTYNIKVLLTGTSENTDSFSFRLIESARKKLIPVITFVDGAGSSNERFKGQTEDSLFWAPNWLVVPDHTTANLYSQLGFDSSRIKLLRHPHYDWILSLKEQWSIDDFEAQRKKWIPLAGNKKVVIFISEISDGLNPELYKRLDSYTLHGDQNNSGRTEIVLDEFLLAFKELDTKPYLILRLHPKQSSADLQSYLEHFDLVSKEENALEIVNASDLVIGMSSSLLSEAYYLGKSVLSIVPDPAEKIYLGDLADLIPGANTRDQIKKQIITALNKSGYSTEIVAGNENSISGLMNFLVSKVFSD
jgi:hypothetical protein